MLDTKVWHPGNAPKTQGRRDHYLCFRDGEAKAWGDKGLCDLLNLTQLTGRSGGRRRRPSLGASRVRRGPGTKASSSPGEHVQLGRLEQDIPLGGSFTFLARAQAPFPPCPTPQSPPFNGPLLPLPQPHECSGLGLLGGWESLDLSQNA